jgi:hypothetical protein
MTLDINPEWVTFNFYTHPNPADPYDVVGAALYPQQQRPPGALPPTDQGVARLHRGQHHLPVAEL